MKIQTLEDRNLLTSMLCCLDGCTNSTYADYSDETLTVNGCTFHRAANNYPIDFAAATNIQTPSTFAAFVENIFNTEYVTLGSLYDHDLAFLNDFEIQLAADISCYETNFDTFNIQCLVDQLSQELCQLNEIQNCAENQIINQITTNTTSLETKLDAICTRTVLEQFVYVCGLTNCDASVTINGCVDNMYCPEAKCLIEREFSNYMGWCNGHNAWVTAVNGLPAFGLNGVPS